MYVSEPHRDDAAPAAAGRGSSPVPDLADSGVIRAVLLLGLGADMRIPPYRDPHSGRVSEKWLVRETDPGSARALDLALGLKAVRPGMYLTVIHLGGPESEPWLRRALARGADRAVRVWDDELAAAHSISGMKAAAGVHTAAKAAILAAAVRAAEARLVLTGSAGVVDAGGHLGVIVAAYLGVPCVTQAVETTFGEDTEALRVTRSLSGGYRERLETTLPVVVTVAAPGGATADAAPPVVPAAALLTAQASDISVWDLADLGVPQEAVRQVETALRHGLPRPARPRLRPVSAPDPSLPAFDRILELIRGSVQRREGRVVRRPAEEIVDDIFDTLRAEGLLDHLHPGRQP